ncbi:MAG: ATP-binding protein [Paludibacteraceae bacterium]|nr:ATP-binding protein [Paludibacteraceae bacterium]
MDKLRLKNYRCLEDTGEVEIKPLTLLVGANSSGKSSFLKFFPLLKQSVGERVNGVFLWNGEYVDFESFNNTVHKGDDCIGMEYVIDGRNSDFFQRSGINVVNVQFVISIKNGVEYLNKVLISYKESNDKSGVDFDAEYEFNPDSDECTVTVNGIKSAARREKVVADKDSRDLFPELYFVHKDKSFEYLSQTSLKAQKECFGDDIPIGIPIWRDRFMSKIVKKTEIITQLKRQRNYKFSEEELAEKANLMLYSLSLIIFKKINGYFSELSSHIKYMGPLRLNTERYYRIQNKKIDELTPDGDNLALVLNSYKLNDNDVLDEFNEWLSRLFQFTIEVETPPGHIELKIINKEGNKYNLVDVGFGYTQILPILTLIWQTIHKIEHSPNNRYCKFSTIAIEQPELHLHPKFQRLFARMLAKAASEYSDKLRIIIETHSAYIIRELGKIVNEGFLSTDCTNIVLFDAKSEEYETYVHSTTFDYDGILKDWPYGFF